MSDVHDWERAAWLDARDRSDHGHLDRDPDDPHAQRAQQRAARNAAAQSLGYGFWSQWTPTGEGDAA
jgi:hypothetical protein